MTVARKLGRVDGSGSAQIGKQEFATKRPHTRHPEDRRFEPKHKDRVYVCDNEPCRAVKRYAEIKKSILFDGQWVHLLELRGRAVSEIERLYNDKMIDATWFCTACHQRLESNIDMTRFRIECCDLDRMERAQRLANQGLLRLKNK